MNDSKIDKLDQPNSRSPEAVLIHALLADPKRAKGLIFTQLPHEVLDLLCDEEPTLLPGSYVDEELQESQTDALFQVNLKAGGIAFIFLVFEHRDRPDPYTPLHLLKCQVRIWENYAQGDPDKLKNLPPVIPLMVYNGEEPWDLPQVSGALPDGKDKHLPHGLG